MRVVSITGAKNGLSALIDLVQHGETVLIVDRGRPVARLDSAVSATMVDPQGRFPTAAGRGRAGGVPLQGASAGARTVAGAWNQRGGGTDRGAPERALRFGTPRP